MPAPQNGMKLQPAAKAPPAPVSRLAKVQKGRMKMPWRYVFYGPEGVGKSTLAAHAPAPIWADAEDGSGQLDVNRYKYRDEEGGHVPRTYEELLFSIDDLTNNEHGYQSFVIDTADRVESLMWKYILEKHSGRSSPLNKSGKQMTSIEEFGFGKGFQLALDEWRALCQRLDRLRAVRRMSIIVLAHAQIRTFKNPIDEDYDRYSLRINALAAGFLREWSDVAGFCCFEEGGSKLDDDSRAKGYSTGKRFIRLTRTAGYDAKTRLSLPDSVELDLVNPWGPLGEAVNDSANTDPENLKAQIAAEVERLGGAVDKAKVEAAVVKAMASNDTEALIRYLNLLKAKEPQQAA